MRLTCPNCGAEYEVPDEVIPTSGRDVQCSNCGDTWYQYHPDFLPEEDDLAYEADDFQEPIEEPAPPLPLPSPKILAHMSHVAKGQLGMMGLMRKAGDLLRSAR